MITIGCMMYCLNDNFLLWLPPVIFEQMSPKMPRKERSLYFMYVILLNSKPL
jgi:hypothetical protein